MTDTDFRGHLADLDAMLEYLQRVRALHGNIPVGSSAGCRYPHLNVVTVHVGLVGAGKGPLRQVSRGGRPCLIVG